MVGSSWQFHVVKNLQFCLVGKGHPQELNNILRVVYVDVPQFLFGYKGNCATRASESAPALEDGRIESNLKITRKYDS